MKIYYHRLNRTGTFMMNTIGFKVIHTLIQQNSKMILIIWFYLQYFWHLTECFYTIVLVPQSKMLAHSLLLGLLSYL